MQTHSQFLTFAICEVAYAEDVVCVRVMVLFNVRSFFWGVLQLHGHFLQLLVQLFKQKNREMIRLMKLYFFFKSSHNRR